MNEPQFIASYYKKYPSRFQDALPAEGASSPPEAQPYEPQSIDSYEATNGTPYITSILNLQNDFKIDPTIEIKSRAIEQHVRNIIQDEGLRDSLVSYQTIIDRMSSRLGNSLESFVREGKGLNVLNTLFQEVALHHKMSGETFLKEVRKEFVQNKVESLTKQLKEYILSINV